MRVRVNGVRLYFDVEGAGLVPDGATMREKPTLVLRHGGSGFDHSAYKPAFSALGAVAQVVYLDHRGNGRSEAGPRDSWTLAQWGDDVRAFCEALGIERPIVLGVSFGGMAALAYATRHPEHPAKLILVSTEAAGTSYRERRVELFERLGGPEVGALARRRFIEGHTDAATLDAWVRLAFPHYTRKPRDPMVAQRVVRRPEVTQWFTRPGGEGQTFDFFPALSRIRCPTLVMGGEDDPMVPIECQIDIARALPAELVRFERFADCGHGVLTDAPERALAVIREFIALMLVLVAAPASAQSPLDFVTFDGIHYLRWAQEPGRALTREDLGMEFAAVECSMAEDRRHCTFGLDAAAAFMPAGTRVYAVRGYRTSFRLAAVVNDRIFLYQAWRNARAKVGADLYDVAGRVRAIDVERGEPTPAAPGTPVRITSSEDVEALVGILTRGAVRPPRPQGFGTPRYWLTLWLADGTTLGRPRSLPRP